MYKKPEFVIIPGAWHVPESVRSLCSTFIFHVAGPPCLFSPLLSFSHVSFSAPILLQFSHLSPLLPSPSHPPTLSSKHTNLMISPSSSNSGNPQLLSSPPYTKYT